MRSGFVIVLELEECWASMADFGVVRLAHGMGRKLSLDQEAEAIFPAALMQHMTAAAILLEVVQIVGTA